ncbi:hypothetical protein FIV42_04695 [Persicimonas caeni]|jgi:hypothetical protein|uniref:Uncharacterized protein n=1 Tax=Persicimonas caeni TaxID=2292766 RepID=A0A4Y6PPN5_PERCE|nr:hypothetical protein [Persicimonas caeni]QDG50059.1 hypothetical protein FIV42_04695 [Persicimonas caeni]QED31280.1 hypothetical protein FRD00_04690 [Persicimonas caeni]
MSEDGKNEFADRPDTYTRLNAIADKGYIVVVTRAYGPDGESLINQDGPKFSGEPGVSLRVKQGDKEDIVTLSPFFGDPSKENSVEFESGKRCELTCPKSGTPLDPIPGMVSDDGGHYYAIYLTPKLEKGELVAISDVWGDTNSRILSEGELLKLYAESEPIEE